MTLAAMLKRDVPQGEHHLIIPDSSGHTTMVWTGDADTETVREKFDSIIAQGYTGYAEAADGTLSTTRVFDETATRIVVMAPLVGG